MEKVRQIREFLDDGLWCAAPDAAPFARRAALHAARFLQVAFGGFVKHRCGLHAAGLTYFSLLAVVPALCLLMVLAKTCGAGDFARERLNGYFDAMIENVEKGAAPVADAPQTAAEKKAADAKAAEADEKRLAQRALARQLRETVNPLIDKVNEMDVSTFGWIGLATLMWTVISAFGQIELSMNEIWEVDKPRGFVRKCALYLLVAVVLPLLATAALSLPVLRVVRRALDATVGAAACTKWMGDALVAVLDSRITAYVFAFVFASLAFAFVLSFMPNRRVMPRAAFEGGVVTALLFGALLRLCTAAQIGIGKSSMLYGSFATPMILLAWIYMSWQIVLFGSNVTYAFQCVHSRSRDGGPR